MKIITTMIVLMLTPLWAIAQDSSFSGISPKRKFTGLSVGVNAEMSSTTLKLETLGIKIDGVGRQSFTTSVQADYGVTLGQNGVLLIGVKRYLADQDLLTISAQNINGKITKTDHTSIYIAPGYLINEKTLAFLKASYERFYLNSSPTNNVININDKLAQGIGLGVGVRTEIANKTLLNIEISKIYYTNDFSLLNVTTGTTSGSIGLMQNFD